MARQRKLSPERKAFINSLIEHYQPEDAQDVQEMLKDLLGDTLQGMLEAEVDASGLVFAFILLNSFTSFKEGEIPLTCILVAFIFIGQQIYDGIFC